MFAPDCLVADQEHPHKEATLTSLTNRRDSEERDRRTEPDPRQEPIHAPEPGSAVRK